MKRLWVLTLAAGALVSGLWATAPAQAQTSELRRTDKILLDYLAEGFTVVSSSGEAVLTIVLQKGTVLAICELQPRGGASSYITRRCLESVGR